ncbi:uncharacterized protein ARMOST_12514 [Armillaria ostoyae]|uniref:Uncharacterized protein n=1 Tax=Armillaria ostoyae TaxID=47428 RepID=A0A284RK48_ARMOS|nr:uncharacterized protein ARMOST_12514 [Armillaria ostoyae]
MPVKAKAALIGVNEVRVYPVRAPDSPPKFFLCIFSDSTQSKPILSIGAFCTRRAACYATGDTSESQNCHFYDLQDIQGPIRLSLMRRRNRLYKNDGQLLTSDRTHCSESLDSNTRACAAHGALTISWRRKVSRDGAPVSLTIPDVRDYKTFSRGQVVFCNVFERYSCINVMKQDIHCNKTFIVNRYF